MNNEYEYSYDSSVEPANGAGTDRYTGFSAYTPAVAQHNTNTLLSPSEDMRQFDAMTTQYSNHWYEDNTDIKSVLSKWDKFDRVSIRSWDLADDPTQTGTILRFTNSKTQLRSADFRFTIMRRGFQRNLKSNMDRVREEVDADLSQLDAHEVGGIQRMSGATPDGAIQLILSRVGNQICYAYMSIADQLFVPIVNKWNLTTNHDCYVLQQALHETSTAAQTVSAIRGF